MTDLRALRELAQKATPGPWAVNPWRAQVDAFDGEKLPLAICQMLWPTKLRTEAQTKVNATFIAACSPARILAMLDVCEAAQDHVADAESPEHSINFSRLTEALARLRGAK